MLMLEFRNLSEKKQFFKNVKEIGFISNTSLKFGSCIDTLNHELDSFMEINKEDLNERNL